MRISDWSSDVCSSDLSAAFDKLALFAFNLSRVGRWKKAAPYQDRPALWAFHYLSERVARDFGWNTRQISADDIERFVSSDERYKARTSRKLSTNLNYLYKQGRISDYKSSRAERWWLSALFLALDRYKAGMENGRASCRER